MRTLTDTQFSILELVPVRDDKTIQFSLQHALELAQAAERLGYSRMWLAEHHNMDGIASSATAVLLGYLLANTNSIKLGSGGIMLPNHAPLVVAEQFGTLATLYPDRIELGLGRVLTIAQRADLHLLPGKKILIAGTNGKGTTARALEQLCAVQGLSVGVYSSPHLLQFNERLRINGEDVADSL